MFVNHSSIPGITWIDNNLIEIYENEWRRINNNALNNAINQINQRIRQKIDSYNHPKIYEVGAQELEKHFIKWLITEGVVGDIETISRLRRHRHSIAKLGFIG
ncbi:MAG: hypothetical protein HC835_14905 [Oscillatoriales cyanobacterium RM2_1_1]|nr:hypothetical protein [Oscillatoriales cyanobacterium SM2_3_0]NJO46801.1 hypothetical protein [Oscillatoriales cyanobacterium RM2_1_1]